MCGVVAIAALTGCNDNGDATSEGASDVTGATASDVTADGDTSGSDESGGEDGTTGAGDGDGDGDGTPADCDYVVPFDPSANGATWEEKAGDFEVTTLRDEFSLSEIWNGCESYYFIGYNLTLFNPLPADMAGFFADAPPNARFFFYAPQTSTEAEATAAVTPLAAALENHLMSQGPELYEQWSTRMHYVVTPGASLPTWMTSLPSQSDSLAVAIDRFQRIREGGWLNVFTSGSNSAPQLHSAAFPPHYFNYEVDVVQKRAAEEADVTVVTASENTLLSDTGTAIIDVTFPDAATMQSFDSMEIELNFECPGNHPYRGNCPAWDRIGGVELCLDDACTERRLIGRVITSYWRPTRAFLEASPFLAYLQDGGPRKLFIEWGPSFDPGPLETNLFFRLQNKGKGMRPQDIQFLWSGGTFDAAYNDNKLTQSYTPPADAARVELVTIVTGHGIDGSSCAEYCNHRHEFTINGGDIFEVEYEPKTSSSDIWGCSRLTAAGVQPNQWGSWYFGRAAWCPGWGVQPWVQDVTSTMTLGGSNDLDYRGWYGANEAGTSGSANISMGTYIVSWK